MKKYYLFLIIALTIGTIGFLTFNQTFQASVDTTNIGQPVPKLHPVTEAMYSSFGDEASNSTINLPYTKTKIVAAITEYNSLAAAKNLTALSAESKAITDEIASGFAQKLSVNQTDSTTNISISDNEGNKLTNLVLSANLVAPTTPESNFVFDTDLPASYSTAFVKYYPKLTQILGSRVDRRAIVVNYTPATYPYMYYVGYTNTIYIQGTSSEYEKDAIQLLSEAYVYLEDWNTNYLNILSSAAMAILYKENNVAPSFLSELDYFSARSELFDPVFSLSYGSHFQTFDYDFKSIIPMYKIYQENRYALGDIYHSLSYYGYRDANNPAIFENVIGTAVPTVENQAFAQWLGDRDWLINSDTKSSELWIEPRLDNDLPYMTENTAKYYLNYRAKQTATTVQIEAFNAAGQSLGSIVKPITVDKTDTSDYWQTTEVTTAEIFGTDHTVFNQYTGLVKFIISPNSSTTDKRIQYFPKVNTNTNPAVNLVGTVTGQVAEVDIINLETAQKINVNITNGLFLSNNAALLEKGKYKVDVYSTGRANLVATKYFNKSDGKYAVKISTTQTACTIGTPAKVSQPNAVKITTTTTPACQSNLYIEGLLVAKAWGTSHQFSVSGLNANTTYNYSVIYGHDGIPKVYTSTFKTLNLPSFNISSAKLYTNSTRTGYYYRLTFSRAYNANTLSKLKVTNDNCSNAIDYGSAYKTLTVPFTLRKISSTAVDLVFSTIPCFNSSYYLNGLTYITDVYNTALNNPYYYNYISMPYNPKTTTVPRVLNPRQDMKINSTYKVSLNFKPLHPSLVKKITLARDHYPYSCYLKYRTTSNYGLKCEPVSTRVTLKGSTLSFKGRKKLEYHNTYYFGVKKSYYVGSASILDNRKNLISLYLDSFTTKAKSGKKAPYPKSYKIYKNSVGSVYKIAVTFNNSIKDNYQYAYVYADAYNNDYYGSYYYPHNLRVTKSGKTVYLYPSKAIPRNTFINVSFPGLRDVYGQYVTYDSRYDLPTSITIPAT